MTYWLAEVGSNHNRDIDRTMRLIDTAADIGCDGVKFQLFRADDLYVRPPAYLAARELPPEFLPAIAEQCYRAGVDFVCSPFSLDAVVALGPHVDRYKVSSFDILRLDLLTALAEEEKPVIISTGMASDSEIRDAVEVFPDSTSVTLLHCVSAYPTKPRDANLSRIRALRDRWRVPVGYSDHTANPLVVGYAVNRWGAEMVEFHFDLDGAGAEYQHGHCFLPDGIAPVIDPHAMEAWDVADDPADPDQRADPTDGKRPRLWAR